MSHIIKRQVPFLALNGKNNQTWALDCELHLRGMQLSHIITARQNDAAAPPPHEQAHAAIFLRHHIHNDLKQEYLEVKDPVTLWTALQERFRKQKTVIHPQARRDWAQLRFLDFKSVEAYNTAIHRIVGQLRFCGQKVTESEMIEKHLKLFTHQIWCSSSSTATKSSRSTLN